MQLRSTMTINKARGQTLDHVGLYLKGLVFSHKQLYTTLSRATMANSIKILIKQLHLPLTSTNITKNVIYEEILSSITNS